MRCHLARGFHVPGGLLVLYAPEPMMRTSVLLWCALVLPFQAGGAPDTGQVLDSATLEQLEREAGAIVRRGRHVGFGISLLVDDRVVWTGTWGEAERGRGLPFDSARPMPLGELGELYLAGLALRLEHAGALDLEAPLYGADIDDRGLGEAVPNIRQVLSHHSGVIGVRLNGMYVEAGDVDGKGAMELPPLYLLDRPGISASRSTLAVEWVARHMARQQGLSVAALMEREVTGPLGLAPLLHAGDVTGPLYSRGREEPARVARERSALGLASSLDQLAAYVAAVLPDARPDWLPQASLDRLYQAQNREARPDLGQRSALAFQLEGDPRPGVGPVARLASNFPASHASVRVSPQHRVAVVAMANFGEADRALEDLLDHAFDALLASRLPGLAQRPSREQLPSRLPLPEGLQPDVPAARYASFGGLVEVEDVDGVLDVRWLGWRFSGEPRGDGWFRPRLRVLRIPLGLQALDRIAIRPVRDGDRRLLLVQGSRGRSFIIGSALEDASSGPDAARWAGTYRIEQDDALLERGRVREVDLVHEDDLLRLQFTARGGPIRASLDMPLVPEGGGYYRIPGLGPGLGDRMRFEERNGSPPRVHFSGYSAVRVE